MKRSRLRWFALAALGLLVAAAGAGAAGFVVGLRWPLEGLEMRLGLREDPKQMGWTELASTDLPRYEIVVARDGHSVYFLGGFHTRQTRAAPRVEVLDLKTGEWTRRDDAPVPLTHAQPAVVRDTAWLAGGFEGDHPGPATDRVWRYSLSHDTWAPGPSLPAPRGGGALVARGDTLHFFGGYATDRETSLGDHWTLVVGDSTWRTAAPLPEPRGHLSGLAVDGEVWAVSGTVGHDPRPVDVRSVHRYLPGEDRWEEAPDLPFSTSHTEPSTVAYDGGILVAGGRALDEGRWTTDDILFYHPEEARWTHLGWTPVPMMGGLAAVHDDTLAAGLGAEYGNNPQTPVIWERPLRDAWWRGADMPEPLGEVAAGVIDGRLLVAGQGSNRTQVFDLAAGRWEPSFTVGARPAPGHHHAAEVVDGEWYLLGGLKGHAPGVVQIYDPSMDRWRLGPPMPFAAGSSASAVIDGRIYVAGGIEADTTTSAAAVLDPATGVWRSIAPMPRPRNHAASATDGTRLWVFGGRGPGSGDRNEVGNGFDDVQVYDPSTDTWTVSDGSPGAPSPLPQARGGMGKAVFLDGEFWILGGETEDGEGATDAGTYARVDVYDPVADRWRRGPDLPTPRHGIFPVLDGGRILVVGGGAEAGFSSSVVLESLWPRTGPEETHGSGGAPAPTP